MDFVNATWARDRVTLYRRDASGRLETSQVRADFAVFLRPEDFERVDRDLRTSGAVRSIKRDGNYWRVSFRDRYVREKIAGPNGWLELKGITTTFEGDVDPVRRFMIDTGSTIQMPRAAGFDIETDSRVPFARKEQARILNWSLSDFSKSGEEGQLCDVLDENTDEAEGTLLLSLFDALEDYDLVLAWNGDRFDFPMIKARLERLKNVLPRGWLRDQLFKIDLRRWLWLDHMSLFRKMNISASESGDEKQSVALQRVWEGVVGKTEGKFERRGVGALAHLTVGGRYAWEFWEAGGENRKLGVKYNVRDTGMMREIEAETGYVAKHLDICRICGVFGESRGMKALRFVETFMMRLLKERGMRAPSKWHGDGDEDRKQFRGAWVLPIEETGILRDVHVFDFSGMYPSIMISLNMSPETRAPEHDVVIKHEHDLPPTPPPGISISPITGKAFRTGVEGVFPIALVELRALRAKFEKIRDTSVPGSPEQVMAERSTTSIKNIINSFYGATGSQWCRFFDVDVAESVTQTGVYLIRELTIPEANKWGMKIVAADTDSGFARGVSEERMREFVKHCNADVYPAFLKSCGATVNVVKLAYETELALMLSVARKKYAARAKHYKGNPVPIFDKDGTPTKPKIKGLEYMRGDWNKLARDLQKTVIDRLLYQGQPIPTAYGLKADDFHDLIAPVRDRIVSGELALSEFVVAKSLRKELDEYERKTLKDGSAGSLAIQVEIGHWMEKNGYDVAEGTRVEYVVTDGDASPMEAVHVDAFVPGTEDRHYIWETLVWPPTGRLLRACFPDYRWDKYDESKPRRKGRGKAAVLAGQATFDFLANDWGNGVPRGL